MIKAIGAAKDGTPAILIGLSRRNCEKLLEGKPIEFNTSSMKIESSTNFPEVAIVIMAAENETELVRILQKTRQIPPIIHEDPTLENPNE